MVRGRLARLRSIVIFFHGWDEKFVQKLAESRLYRFVSQRTYGQASIIIVLATRFKEQLVALDIDGSRIRVQTTMFDGRLDRDCRCKSQLGLTLPVSTGRNRAKYRAVLEPTEADVDR